MKFIFLILSILISVSVQARVMNANIAPASELIAVVDVQCLQAQNINDNVELLGGLVNSTDVLKLADATGLQIVSQKFSTDRMLHALQMDELVAHESCILQWGYNGRIEKFGKSNDPFYNDQGHHFDIKTPEAYGMISSTMKTDTSDVVIAVIDSGVDIDHVEFKGSVAPGGWDFTTNKPEPRPTPDRWGSMDDHGTHVAGIAAARSDNGVGVAGIFGRARVLSLNVFGDWGYSEYYIIENAIRYAADHGAKVINLSLGGQDFSPTMESALRYAIGKGVVVVAAAGNNGVELSLDKNSQNYFIPASWGAQLKGMITVGATRVLNQDLASFSNYGVSSVEIAAPGSQDLGGIMGIFSTATKNAYISMSGTSMASPMVAGAAALAIGYAKSLGLNPTPAQVEDWILNSARSQSTLTKIQGRRHLDLQRLLQAIH